MSKLFKLKKSACVLSVLVLGGSLAACGGGGGGGAMSATTSSGLDATTTATTPTPPITSQPSTVSTTTQLAPTFRFDIAVKYTPNITYIPAFPITDEQGKSHVYPPITNDHPGERDLSAISATVSRIAINSTSLTHLAVDKIDLDIVPSENSDPLPLEGDGNFYFSAKENGPKYMQAKTGNNLSYAVWGSAIYGHSYSTQAEGEQLNQRYYFSQGYLTADMPTTGTATYSGLSIVYDDTRSYERGSEYKLSAFNVNFANKNLTGTINDKDGTALLNLSANISGNGFYGIGADGTHTTGAFYGPKAAELAGGFYNIEKSITGAFGAKKD